MNGSLMYAARTESMPTSQLYLWMLSRIDTRALVNATVEAVRTGYSTTFTVTQYSIHDTLPCGMRVINALRQFGGMALLHHLTGGYAFYVKDGPGLYSLCVTVRPYDYPEIYYNGGNSVHERTTSSGGV